MNYYKGLNSRQVEESRLRHGSNILTPAPKESWLKLLLSKFNDPLIKVLVIAAAVSVIVDIWSPEGSLYESIGIIAAIFLATFIAFVNEYKAGKEFDILNKINDTVAVKVVRSVSEKRQWAEDKEVTKVIEIPKSEVVVGDYVIISAGDDIPADGILQDCMGLEVNESALNGESKPASKSAAKVESFKGAYPPNMVFRGTAVSEGEGVFLVTAVGDATEIGKTARQASEITGVQTPLSKQLTALGKLIGKAGVWIAVVTFLILFVSELLHGSIHSPVLSSENAALILKLFMIAVTLIVMAVPEGLPMSITLSLAYSMRRMTAQNMLVRRMHACETMGAVTVICSDKTGTLTLNKMVVHYCSVPVDEAFAKDIACNSTAFLDGDKVIGNPTEGALLLYLKNHNIDYSELRKSCRLVDRVPFSSKLKYMVSVYETEGRERTAIKGGPEIILSKCALEADALQKELEEIARYQRRGMRCIAFAHREAGTAFVYDGFAAIEDPVREDVPAAMKMCSHAGIAVKIVTGDTSLTAIEIARQSGLWGEEDVPEINSITGPEFEMLSDEEALKKARQIKVMSRARPQDKMRLVKLLQQQSEVVAVTGDGTNDAPALNYADVGLAMGSGTAVAKESSDIILLDDSFASIVSAVQWGRSIYINIQKFICFQLTVNVAALLTAMLGPLMGVEFPLTVTQILWINLIMDTLAALALATEPSYAQVMRRKPRKIGESIITRQMRRRIFGYGTAFFAISYLFLLVERLLYPSEGVDRYMLTIFFTVFVMLQLWNLFNVRMLGSTHSAFYNLGGNRMFIAIAAIIFILQIVIVEFGGSVMRTQPLGLMEWACIVAGTSLVLWAGETSRIMRRRTVKPGNK